MNVDTLGVTVLLERLVLQPLDAIDQRLDKGLASLTRRICAQWAHDIEEQLPGVTIHARLNCN